MSVKFEKTFRKVGDKVTEMDLNNIIQWANYKAREAINEYLVSEDFIVERAGGCGYAWVEIRGIDGKKVRKNSSADRVFVAKGITRNCYNYPMAWRPGEYAGQSIEVHKVGAIEFARVLKMNGIDAVPGARYD